MKRRSGFTILETLVAVAMLTALLAVAMQVCTATAAQRRQTQQQLVAVEETANVMERVAALPWDDLTPEGVGKIELSTVAEEALPEAALTIDLAEAKGKPAGRRVAVTLEWAPRAAGPPSQTQLVAWRYQP